MKRSFVVGGAAFAFMLAVAFSFGANSAEAQLLCGVKTRCCKPVVKKTCGVKLLRVRTSCCSTETAAAEEETKTDCCETKCCKRPNLLARLRCCKPAKTCCEAEKTETDCCATKCCKRPRLLAKLLCCKPKCGCKATCGCGSGCEATEAEGDIPPAPEAAKATT